MILTIAIPTKGVCDTGFAVALRLLDLPLYKEEDRYSVVYVSGADVAVARNLLVEKSMGVGDYIMFFDDDVLPPMNAITKLISHDKDIITGLYFAKQQPHFPQIFTKNKEVTERYDSVENYAKDSLIEIDACGAGCLLIKTEVFKKLKKPYFQYIPKGENNPRKGEDFYFCEKAKEAGYKIWCDTSIQCKHIGNYYINANDWEYSLKEIERMRKEMGEEKFKEFKKANYE